jgi:hypothetical protein
MFPHENEQGEPEYSMPIAQVFILGKLAQMQFGIWYLCSNQKCQASATLLPDYPDTKEKK